MCMYNTNFRSDQTQPENQLPLQPIIASTPVVTMTENVDWRTNLHYHNRQKIVNKIMKTLQRHLPFPVHEGSSRFKEIVERFEEKMYTDATSQSDYFRKIALKVLTVVNAPQPNVGTINQDPADSGSGGIEAQVHNQAQQLPMPIMGNQRQQLLPQTLQNNMESTVMHNSASLTTAPPRAVGMSPPSISNVNGQNCNLQNISNVAQNSMANFMVQGMPSNMFTNTQQHMLGRQQQVVYQQSQNPQHYLNQLLLQQANLSSMHQHQISKQKQQHFINSGMPGNQQNVHMLQQSRVTAQQPLQPSAGLLPTHGQQIQQMQLPQQQSMSHIQSQIAQLQQQIVSLQQQANTLQTDTHQRLQTSSSLLPQNVVDLQKQMSQLQMRIPDEPSSMLF